MKTKECVAKKLQLGTRVRVRTPYTWLDRYLMGKEGVVVEYLGTGLEGPAVVVQFEDLPEDLRHLKFRSFPVHCLSLVG